jgi:hypothetical protein
LKEIMLKLPQIDAQFDHNSDPLYASEILDIMLKYYTLDQISLHSGICRRSVSYMRHRGFRSYPDQLVMEILAGKRSLDG